MVCTVSLNDIYRSNSHHFIFQGDVQPYVALGKQLEKGGHCVRIASHETFREFVLASGLDFFSIGGNPQDLMSYMVKSTP